MRGGPRGGGGSQGQNYQGSGGSYRGGGGYQGYRGRGGGRDGGRGGYGKTSYDSGHRGEDVMKERNKDSLAENLRKIDGKSFGAYKDLLGSWEFENFTLSCNHVQSDPYAPPSRFSVLVPASAAKFPEKFFSSTLRRIASADYLTRIFSAYVSTQGYNVNVSSGKNWSGEKGGALSMSCPNQYVLQRTSVIVSSDGGVEGRFTIELPARGRSISGEFASHILLVTIPKMVQFLFYNNQDPEKMWQHVACVEDQNNLRQQLDSKNLVSFIANGSILPRESGLAHTPMKSQDAVAFQSPPELELEVEMPHIGKIKGMGIPKGITIIVGGGFHGKTTLLNAIELGVYNKIVGDGREYVVTSIDAAKIRSEDGRSVTGCNISPFINNLPNKKSSIKFTTTDASGSTSQASSFIEALEVGSSVILLDEDTSATNILMRDKRMQSLVTKEEEPITPIINKIEQLFEEKGVSTIMVMGGSGEYFDVANTVIKMYNYTPSCVTEQAKALAEEFPTNRAHEGGKSFDSFSDKEKFTVKHKQLVYFGETELSLIGVEHLVEEEQTRCILSTLLYLRQYFDKKRTIREILEILEEEWDTKGLDVSSDWKKPGNISRPRLLEVAMTMNRISSLKVD